MYAAALRWVDEPPEQQSGRTRNRSPQSHRMSDTCIEALLAHAKKKANATKTKKEGRLEEVLEEGRGEAHISLLEERLQEKYE